MLPVSERQTFAPSGASCDGRGRSGNELLPRLSSLDGEHLVDVDSVVLRHDNAASKVGAQDLRPPLTGVGCRPSAESNTVAHTTHWGVRCVVRR